MRARTNFATAVLAVVVLAGIGGRAETPTPTPYHDFHVEVTVVPSQTTVTVGQAITVTVYLDDQSVGCQWRGYDLTLSQIGDDAPLFDPEIQVIGPPIGEVEAFQVLALEAGTIQFRASAFGESECGGVFQWQVVGADSDPVQVVAFTPTPTPTPAETPDAFHVPSSGITCQAGRTMRDPLQPVDPSAGVCLTVAVNDVSFYRAEELIYRLAVGPWQSRSFDWECWHPSMYHNLYSTGCEGAGWIPGAAPGETVDYVIRLRDLDDTCSFYLHGEQDPRLTSNPDAAKADPFEFTYPTEPPHTPPPTPSWTATPAPPTPPPSCVTYALRLQDHELEAGDLFLLESRTGNWVFDPLWADEYVVLDVGGEYWFWPSWSQQPDHATWHLAYLAIREQEILRFLWPVGAGDAANLAFHGAILHHGTTELLQYTWLEWEYR